MESKPEIIIKRTLDTVRSNRNISIISVSGDYGARFIDAVVTVDGRAAFISPYCAVTINAKREDGASNRFVGSVNDDGSVRVPITQWMLDVPHSSVETTVSISDESSKVSTTAFYINVQDTPHRGEEVSQDDPEYDIVVQAIAAGERAENAAQQAENNRSFCESAQEKISEMLGDVGDIGAALDELHAYAQTLVNGGAS